MDSFQAATPPHTELAGWGSSQWPPNKEARELWVLGSPLSSLPLGGGEKVVPLGVVGGDLEVFPL
jgi:hypothetical protein